MCDLFCRSGCRGSFWPTGFPAVQVMGDAVAVAAFGELGQHAGRMRSAVAILASRDEFVFVFVAGNASHGFMLGSCLAQQIKCLFVAGCTHLVGCVGGIGNCCWHVGLVATFAIRSRHVGAVRFVALRTQRDLAVYVMTEAACQAGVLALDLTQFNNLLCVAAEAFFGDVIAQFDNLGCVRVVVATQTIGQFVVGLAAVAFAASRDDILDSRWMTDMAILTGDACFVRSALGCNIGNHGGVALNAVGVCQCVCAERKR